MTGEILKRLRAIYGYNAKEFSQLIEISPSYLSEIENDKKQPSLELLEKYSKIFDVKLSSLFLLSEYFEENDNTEKGSTFVRNLMMNLINRTYDGIKDESKT